MEIAVSLLILVAAIVIGIPVPFCFTLSIIWLHITLGVSPQFFHRTAYSQISSIVLLAIPLFILSGGIVTKGKIGEAMVNWVSLFIGRVKGAMGILAVLASTGFSAMAGSGAATVSAIGSILGPNMREKNYNMGKCAAIVCCAGPLGLVLPPSPTQILYAWQGGLSVLTCFLAIVGPGLMLSAILTIGAYILLRKEEGAIMSDAIPKGEFLSQFGKRSFHAIPALMLPVILLGGIYGGFMTPTEAAGMSVLYAIPIGLFVYKGLTFKELGNTLLSTGTTTGTLMVMIAIVMIFSTILVRESLHTILLNLLLGISENPHVIMIMINITVILIAAVMDDASAILLCTPILLPIVRHIGVNPYHFAAILGTNIAMGNVTPPTAPFIFLAARILDVPVSEMIKPVMQILAFCYVPALLITIFFPELSLWLPRLVLGSV